MKKNRNNNGYLRIENVSYNASIAQKLHMRSKETYNYEIRDDKINTNSKLFAKRNIFFWKKVTHQNISSNQKETSLQDFFIIIKDKIDDIAKDHIASRVIQNILRKSSQVHRKSVLLECLPKLVLLSKSPYGHFVVKKMISLLREHLKDIQQRFSGHICELLQDPYGTSVIDSLYRCSRCQQRNLMAAEFLGCDSFIFDSKKCQALTELKSKYLKKRLYFVTKIAINISQILEKKLVTPSIVHRVLAEYLDYASPHATFDAANSISDSMIKQIICTREGIFAAISIVSVLSKKRIEKIIQIIKKNFTKLLRVRFSYVFLLSLILIDNTNLLLKLVNQQLIREIQRPCHHFPTIQILLCLLNPIDSISLRTFLVKIFGMHDYIITGRIIESNHNKSSIYRLNYKAFLKIIYKLTTSQSENLNNEQILQNKSFTRACSICFDELNNLSYNSYLVLKMLKMIKTTLKNNKKNLESFKLCKEIFGREHQCQSNFLPSNSNCQVSKLLEFTSYYKSFKK